MLSTKTWPIFYRHDRSHRCDADVLLFLVGVVHVEHCSSVPEQDRSADSDGKDQEDDHQAGDPARGVPKGSDQRPLTIMVPPAVPLVYAAPRPGARRQLPRASLYMVIISIERSRVLMAMIINNSRRHGRLRKSEQGE